MNTLNYILVDQKPVPMDDLDEWCRWASQTSNRIVDQTELENGVLVSTVFLGIDHNYSDSGDPILFETMIFRGPHDGYQTRCCTWEQAKKMHQEALNVVKNEGEKHDNDDNRNKA